MPTWRMRTARRAAPLLPENNDGSSYLYISLNDLTPESIHHRSAECATRCASLTRLEGTQHFRRVPSFPSASKEVDTHRARTASALLYNKVTFARPGITISPLRAARLP